MSDVYLPPCTKWEGEVRFSIDKAEEGVVISITCDCLDTNDRCVFMRIMSPKGIAALKPDGWDEQDNE